MGIAIDEWGNFTNPNDRKKHGGPGQVPNNISIRGPGNGTDTDPLAYVYQTHAVAPQSLYRPQGTTRPSQTGADYRRVKMLLLPNSNGYSIIVQVQLERPQA